MVNVYGTNGTNGNVIPFADIDTTSSKMKNVDFFVYDL